MFILPLLLLGAVHWVPSLRLAPPEAPGAWLFSAGAVAEEFPFCFLWSRQWRNQVPGGLRHDESACPGSKLENLHPVEKIQAHPRPPVNGSGLSIVGRGGGLLLYQWLYILLFQMNKQLIYYKESML